MSQSRAFEKTDPRLNADDLESPPNELEEDASSDGSGHDLKEKTLSWQQVNQIPLSALLFNSILIIINYTFFLGVLVSQLDGLALALGICRPCYPVLPIDLCNIGDGGRGNSNLVDRTCHSLYLPVRPLFYPLVSLNR